jgi:hypothetical protein
VSSEQDQSSALHEIVDSEFDKYKLWAANVGAMHSGEQYDLSLDYRLRESPFYRDRVSRAISKSWLCC